SSGRQLSHYRQFLGKPLPPPGVPLREQILQKPRVLGDSGKVPAAPQHWQIEKSRFRHTLAGCMVMIHEHLDGRISIRYGPHVLGQFDAPRRAILPAARGGSVKGAAAISLRQQGI
ncbi:MAG TPA: hypothetical protein VKV17_10115, partial [Bryobacteraceae bacterium]|nr:hypothetical protein [Bryobacteraceae bacterium]